MDLGQRVNTDAPAAATPTLTSELGEPDAESWRKIVLRAVNAADADVEIELLRPLSWLTEHGAAVGAVMEVHLPELHVHGPARVLAIESSPMIESGGGTVVTGRFRHVASNLLDVYVEHQIGTGTTGGACPHDSSASSPPSAPSGGACPQLSPSRTRI